MDSESIQVHAEGWNHYIARQITPRWPPVCVDWFPDDGKPSVDWTWLFMQYVFPVGDPRDFEPLPDAQWSHDEKAALRRYVSHAKNLAGTTLLTARDGFSVYVPTPGSEPQITERVTPRDATTGFLTMFRQIYSPAELASFKRAYDLLAREAHRLGADLATLKTWRRMHATLRHTHLDHLILVRAAADGHVSSHLAERNASHPSTVDSPERMISTIFYGDWIHWGDHRTAIEAGAADPVLAVKRRFDALRATVHLGHLYVGFAAVVGLVSRILTAEDV